MPISSPASKVVRFRSSWVFRRPDDAARSVRDAHKTTPSLRVLLRSRPSERRPRLAETRSPTSETDHLGPPSAMFIRNRESLMLGGTMRKARQKSAARSATERYLPLAYFVLAVALV